MNSNLLHNIINTIIVAIPALEQFNFTPFLDDATALKVVGVLGLAKILINAHRDGVKGMAKPQPPVQQ